MHYEIKILGCGGSSGVPDIEKGWGACDPSNKKNYRTRTSAFISATKTNQPQSCSIKDIFKIKETSLEKISLQNNDCFNILFDSSPDLRQQALMCNIKKIDSILFTHAHADHIYGMDDLRSINRLMQKSIKAFANQETFDNIKKSFSYIFEESLRELKNPFYKPRLDFSIIDYFENISLTPNIHVETVLQNHGRMDTMGFIINKRIGYATDFVDLPVKSIEKYTNLDILIISAFTTKTHISHMNLDQVLKLLEVLNPKLAVLTHMGPRMDYSTLKSTLPRNVIPAYDGMIISNF